MHLLTSAADGFEAKGPRERAFDCYGVLLTIGREGSFENLAEGYLNCIRILREDGLKYYVLQYYEDFQKLAEERTELDSITDWWSGEDAVTENLCPPPRPTN